MNDLIWYLETYFYRFYCDKMNRKIDVKDTFLLAPLPVVLVGCAHKELGHNLLTIAWCGVDCSEPPLIHISVRPSRHSYRMIRESGCFTVNIPTKELLEKVDKCGLVSGREGDKFERVGLTALDGSAVEAPIVAECPVNIECRVKQVLELGVHHMFIGEVVAVRADEELVGDDGSLDLSRVSLFAYVHGEYVELGKRLGGYGCSE